MHASLNRHFWIATACGGCVAIAILSLLPGYLRPHTGAPGSFEHFAAYLLVAGAFALGLRANRSVLIVALGLMAAAGLFEILQLDIPGRHAGVIGFAASSLGVWAGIGLAALCRAIGQGRAIGGLKQN